MKSFEEILEELIAECKLNPVFKNSDFSEETPDGQLLRILAQITVDF